MKTVISYYFLPFAMNANFVLFSKICATKTFVKYWHLIWWKSHIPRYIDFVGGNQYQPHTNSAQWVKISYTHNAV